MITFHLPIIPPRSTSQGKRLALVNGKPMFFKAKQHAAAENDLLSLCATYRPDSPLLGPVFLQVDMTFPWRKSENMKRIALGSVPHTSKPDLDNMAKLVGDVLTKLQFYGDDSQVADLRLRKFWGDKVGINITIGEL